MSKTPKNHPSEALAPRVVATIAPADLALVWKVWHGKLAENTRASYELDLQSFAAWLRETKRAQADGPKDAVQWLIGCRRVEAEAAVIEYLEYLLASGYRTSTVRRHRSAIREAVACCEGIGLVGWTLTADMPKGVERSTKRSTAGPEFSEYQEMLRVAGEQADELRAARDVALLRTVVAMRIRESEVCRLTLADYANEALSLILKGHHDPTWVHMPTGAQGALDSYLELRPKGTPSTAPLFAALHGGHLTRGGLYKIIRELARAAGIEKVVSPHRLLHTGGTRLADKGYSTDQIQQWGRWRKPETAQAYIDHHERIPERLAEVLDHDIDEDQGDDR